MGTQGHPLNPAAGTGAGLENYQPLTGCRAELQPITVSSECLAQLQRETSRCGGAACSKRAGKGGEPPCLSIWLADSRPAASAPQEQRFAFRAEEGGGEKHGPSSSFLQSRGVPAAHGAEGHGGGLQRGSASFSGGEKLLPAPCCAVEGNGGNALLPSQQTPPAVCNRNGQPHTFSNPNPSPTV